MSGPQSNETFGQWLRRRRKAKDLTQEQLADRMFMSPEIIRKLESGERRPSADTADVIADFFGVPPEERPAFIKFARYGPSGE
jgi:transcriptional regulator with XRE-family HTH domain